MPAAAPIKESVLVRIRRETRTVHEALESELNLLDPGLSESRYCELLKRFYGFYAPWEEALQPWIEKIDPLSSSLYRRSPEIVRDLDFFEWDAADVPLCPFVPAIKSVPAAIGNLYVREGASLGGQIIGRHLQAALGLSEGRGYRFFSSAGHNVGQEWKQFQQGLLAHSSRENEDQIIAAAQSAFEAIYRWFRVG